MATPPVVQLLPMSTDVFPGRGIADVQAHFFLGELATLPRNGRYEFRTAGLSADPGKVVLFQFARHVVASAELLGCERFAEPEDGCVGAMHFDPASVRVFDPVGADVLAEVWPDQFPGFGQAKTRLSGDRYPEFLARLTNVRGPRR
ncbi:hypothetical protein [Urbifossiella limnaea]|uniref:Uncharacterized protein n=1 Tax=Urbifossiella limnaea TaxID=2528023 RepID=A0A517XM88_9BACT|nr:hypothetical protein [Urbifossiella limnaea]QDU18628.1 hypothetical protein ETAA1_05210 [Urbifossiella limnaea]